MPNSRAHRRSHPVPLRRGRDRRLLRYWGFLVWASAGGSPRAPLAFRPVEARALEPRTRRDVRASEAADNRGDMAAPPVFGSVRHGDQSLRRAGLPDAGRARAATRSLAGNRPFATTFERVRSYAA